MHIISVCFVMLPSTDFVVATCQLALADGPTDKCHVGNVTKNSFTWSLCWRAGEELAELALICVCFVCMQSKKLDQKINK